jgi:ferric-dicitrate binding protein FerR (iron transport regulator)
MLRFFKPQRALALLAAAALLNLSAPARAAESARRPAPSGQVATAAGLSVDGMPAVAGQTVFPGSSFDTGEGARPLLELGNRARLELSGRTALKLDFNDESVGGALGAGATRVYAPRGVAASLTTADASVLSDAAEPALFRLEVSAEGTTLTVQLGRVEMRAGGAARTVSAGETLRSSGGSAPAEPQGGNDDDDDDDDRKRAAIILGVGGAIAAILIVIAARDDDDADDEDDGCIPILSGDVPPGC